MSDTVTTGHKPTRINHFPYLIIYDDDSDFGSVDVIDTESISTARIVAESKKWLNDTVTSVSGTEDQTFGSVGQIFRMFFLKPGLCTVLQHEINVSADFKPKRLRANLKPMVEAQINELLKLGIIKPSKTEMGSPIVCVSCSTPTHTQTQLVTIN